MKKLASIAIATMTVLSLLAPVAKVEAFNNIVIQSPGLHIYTPTEMKVGKFNMKLQLRNYIDNKSVKNYEFVHWRVEGCGLNVDTTWNKSTHYSKLVGTNPTLTIKGTLPAEKECTMDITIDSQACRLNSEGRCTNIFQNLYSSMYLDVSLQDDIVPITGPAEVKVGSRPQYESNFTSDQMPLISEQRWTWSATRSDRKTCSRPTYHNQLNPIFDARINKNLGDCVVKAKGIYLIASDGQEKVDYNLNYINGSYKIKVVK